MPGGRPFINQPTRFSAIQMKIQTKEISLVPLSEIKLNPRNRNLHNPDQIKQFVKILKRQGFRIPGVVSNRSGQLCAGEGRYLALKEIGATHMPIMFQDFEDEEQEFLFGVSDNAIASQAELDLSQIHVDIQHLGPFDLDLLGIKNFQLEPSEMDIDVGEAGEGSSPEVTQCPNCGHLIK